MKIQGSIKSSKSDSEIDLTGYAIILLYSSVQTGPAQTLGEIDAQAGSYVINLPDGEIAQPIVLVVKYPNGQEAARIPIASPLDTTGATPIPIAVAPWSPLLPNTNNQLTEKRIKLKGKVFDIAGKSKIKTCQIILWAKRAENDTLATVLVATTDSFGSFSGEYPKGKFKEAFATVAGTLHNTIETALRVDLEVGTDTIDANAKRFPEFIYLAVSVSEDYGKYEDDCDCKTFKSFELPDQEELVNNNSQYAQDIGQGCTQMITPNRTLEEFTLHMVVRTSDPEIKGLTVTDLERRRQAGDNMPIKEYLDIYNPRAIVRPSIVELTEKLRRPSIPVGIKDLTSVTQAGAFAQNPNISAVTENAASVSQIEQAFNVTQQSPALIGVAESAVEKREPTTPPTTTATETNTNNTIAKTVPGRAPLSAENSMDWDNEPTFYQAVSIAHGHILKFKQIWKAAGYSLGDLLYSVPLAPGQKKNIVIFDWDRSTEAGKSDETRFEAGLENSLTHQRDIQDVMRMSLGETSRGGSRAHTSGKSGGIGGGAMVPLGKIMVGISGGYSATSGSASSEAWQQSSRNISGNALQSISDNVKQAASEFRNQRTTVVASARQAERYKVETEVIANHNHCHALTIQYFEVLRHYVIEQKLVDVQECLFIPLLMSQFDHQKIMRWKEILRRNLLDTGYDPYSNKNLDDAFASVERIWNNYIDSDFPLNTYAEEQIIDIFGDMHIRMRINRPPDPTDEGQWMLVYRNYCMIGGFTLILSHNFEPTRTQV